MTFTFDTSLSTDLALVRFNIGDTSDEGHYLEDETINALLASKGSVGGAVVASIKYILTQLSVPNFRKDWLTVDYDMARKGFENMLKVKAQEFGVSLSNVTVSSSVSLPYRKDSYQDSDDGTWDGSP